MRFFFLFPPQIKYYMPCPIGSIPGLGRISGEGHGNPLQYSCLENPKDRGAWQGHKSWARLKWLSTALPILKADKNKAALFKVRLRSRELYPINTSLPPSSFHIYLLRESLHPEIATKTVEMSVWQMQMGPDGEEVEY